MTGREMHAVLDLLDRQLRDRDGRLCGNVDDLELAQTPEGDWYVSAILSGRGTLARRVGWRRLGGWLEQLRSQQAAEPDREREDPGRIPMALAERVGPVIDLATSADKLASEQTERWTRDHVIDHIPGSRHGSDQ